MKWEGTKGDWNGTLELVAFEAHFQVCLVNGENAPWNSSVLGGNAE